MKKSLSIINVMAISFFSLMSCYLEDIHDFPTTIEEEQIEEQIMEETESEVTSTSLSVVVDKDPLVDTSEKNHTFDSITLSIDQQELYAEFETINCTVFGKMRGSKQIVDISHLASFYVDDELIGSSSYLFPQGGTYAVYAKIGTQISDTLTIDVRDVPATFVHKVLIENYTGTWCGFCPRVLAGIEKMQATTDRVVVAAIHNGDDWHLHACHTWADKFGLRSLSTAVLNRTAIWEYDEATNINQSINMLQENAKYGIALSSALGTSSGTIDVTFCFREAVPDAKCVVYVLEDDIIANQENYYTDSDGYFGGMNPIANFVHKNIVKTSVTNILGDQITADQSVIGLYKNTFHANYPQGKVANLKVMAMLLDASGKVLNVQVVPANQKSGFEDAV